MKKFTLILITFIPIVLQASELKLSRPILYIESGSTYAVLNISWENAWNNKKNNDGIWLFFKSVLEDGYQHISVMKEGHSTVSVFTETDPSLKFKAADDGAGIFVFPTIEFRGDISATIKIALNPKSFDGINTRGSSFLAYGIEMVSIPKGGFEIGSPNKNSLDYGAFYKPDYKGDFGGVIKIESENQNFTISTNGNIYYQAKEGYEGDQTGKIPSTFPKGVNPFIIMKYEPTEGQYTDFLNTLSESQLINRVIINEDNYYDQGGTISLIERKYISPFPDKPCLFMSWADAMAYADWAGLRPITEFEFTKAARGPLSATNDDFPWGTNSREQIQRYPDENGRLRMLNGWDESYLKEDHKKYFGASLYWVMDLSGSLWERVVSVGHENGRFFKGSNGDGLISVDGNATNIDWPSGEENSGGVGFRGGGFYGYDREYHEFNPFSPICYRPYGGWHGVMRTNSYGARFARSIK